MVRWQQQEQVQQHAQRVLSNCEVERMMLIVLVLQVQTRLMVKQQVPMQESPVAPLVVDAGMCTLVLVSTLRSDVDGRSVWMMRCIHRGERTHIDLHT